METEKPVDYQIVLADLEAKKEAIENAIAGIKRILGEAGPPGSETSPKQHGRAPTLTPTAFFGMSVADAAIKYLGIVKEPKSTPDIAKALQDHGLKTVAKDFKVNVFSALDRRATNEGDVVHPKRGLWGLKEWYPGMRAGRKEENGKKEPGADPAKSDSAPKPEPPKASVRRFVAAKPHGDST